MTTKELEKHGNFVDHSIRFGTDGWRGIIGEKFTFENVRLVASAIAKTFDPGKSRKHPIFIGYDHRFMAEKFAKEVAKVLTKFRFRAYVLPQAVTSPMLSFVTWHQKSQFGVMVTASHNPCEYLGLKVKGTFGGSISQQTVTKIEENLSALSGEPSGGHPQFTNSSVELNKNKMSGEPDHLLNFYFAYLKKHIDLSLFNERKFAIAFDGLYGPGGKVIGQFFGSFKNKISIEMIHSKRDPLFGGLHPEPIEEYLSGLKTSVKKSKSAVGFAVDGDGDRLGIIDENGSYLTPQQVFALLLDYLIEEKKLKGKVVQTVSLGYLSERISKNFNLPFEEVPVGFKTVAEKMLAEDVMIGGEESGGYAFSRTNSASAKRSVLPERDGLFSALLFLEMILMKGKKVSECLNKLESRYGPSQYLRYDIPLERPIKDKAQFIAKIQNQFPDQWLGMSVTEMRTLDGLKIVLSDGSWLLMRPSGTEPLLRTYAEFPKMSLARDSLDKIHKLVYNVLNL